MNFVKINMNFNIKDGLIGEYELWFNEKFGCLPYEKHHGVGFYNIQEVLSLRRDFPNDILFKIITFEEYKENINNNKI